MNSLVLAFWASYSNSFSIWGIRSDEDPVLARENGKFNEKIDFFNNLQKYLSTSI